MLGEVEKVYGILAVSTQETTMDTATQNLHGRHGSLIPGGHLEAKFWFEISNGY